MDIYTSSTLLNANTASIISDAREDYISGDDILTQVGKINVSVLPILTHELTTFYNDVSTSGLVRVRKGINIEGELQTVPYSGAIQHRELIGLDSYHHPQYIAATGDSMTGNLGVNRSWINSSGADNLGISFKTNSVTSESFVIGDNTSLVFDNDDSKLESGFGVARAWIAFDATETPIVVKSSYNVNTIHRESAGKFIITFKENIKGDYAAITSSNGLSGDSAADVGVVSAACSFRKENTCGFVVQNRSGQYVDSTTNDLDIFSTN